MLQEIAAFLNITAYLRKVVEKFRAWRRTWSQSSSGDKKNEREVAERVLRRAYKIRDAIKACRSSDPSKFPDKEYMPKMEKTNWKLFFYWRLDAVELWQKQFDDAVTAAEVLWGPEISVRKLADELLKCVTDLQKEILEYLEAEAYNSRDRLNWQSGKVAQCAVFQQHENDEFAARVEHAVAEIDALVRPYT